MQLTTRNIKYLAKSLRGELQALDVHIGHGQCLEMVSRQFGFNGWNEFSAFLMRDHIFTIQLLVAYDEFNAAKHFYKFVFEQSIFNGTRTSQDHQSFQWDINGTVISVTSIPRAYNIGKQQNTFWPPVYKITTSHASRIIKRAVNSGALLLDDDRLSLLAPAPIFLDPFGAAWAVSDKR